MNPEIVTSIDPMFAHREWASRPADQRFETLESLQEAVTNRRNRARVYDLTSKDFHFSALPTDGDEGPALIAEIGAETASPTHWTFGQVSALVGAPAGWLRKLPVPLAVENLNEGIRMRESEGVKILTLDSIGQDTLSTLHAVTSQTYGRIWDADVVKATARVIAANEGRFFNPKEWGGKPSGLYASDRDIFLFFIDGGSIVDGGGERDQLHRGFFVKNSEVGSAVFELATFLFRMVCGNHIIHGLDAVEGVKIRHTSGGPERFVSEAIPALKAYSEKSQKPMQSTIHAAKEFRLPRKPEDFTEFFQNKGFTRTEINRAKGAAEREEGRAASLWDMVNGFTADARTLAFMDARVDLEQRAGKLLKLVA